VDYGTFRFLQGLAATLAALNGKVDKMSAEMDALKAQVTQNGSVIDGAVALINGIAARIDAALAGAQVDRQALVDLSAELKAKDDALAAAVAANTPAAP
jgi:hypothetical protein